MMPSEKSSKVWEFGDFQTPEVLAQSAIEHLKLSLPDFLPSTIIEPTCGRGAFLLAAADAYPNANIIGVEIEPKYASSLKEMVALRDDAERFNIEQKDFFEVDWDARLQLISGPVLIVGNPPWVTSSDIGRLRGSNLPKKSNFKNYKGFEAITGRSNFDISEWMLLQHLEWLLAKSGCIALLCKTSVARKILRSIWRSDTQVYESQIVKIDALKSFGASVDACFFILRSNPRALSQCPVFNEFGETQSSSYLGFSHGVMLSDASVFKQHRGLLGANQTYVWRSGIKHDCSRVMELKKSELGLSNGLGEKVEIEKEYLYPLLKSSDVGNGRLTKARIMAVVTQRKVGEPTHAISVKAPKTWDYLVRHGDSLDARKSIIYKKSPRFAIFGVGDYTFSPWKIAISGFYKKLHFNCVSPINDTPVVFDDTVYFLSAYSYEEMIFLADILNSKMATEFLSSMIFWSDKRPITADLLKRLDLKKLALTLGRLDEYHHHIEVRDKNIQSCKIEVWNTKP